VKRQNFLRREKRLPPPPPCPLDIAMDQILANSLKCTVLCP
jgi:hypothetical protein